MGLFDLFKDRKGPGQSWVAAPGLVLTFDFDRHALGDAAIGSSLEAISFLGPAEDMTRARTGSYCFYALGLEVSVEQGRIVSFLLFSRDDSPAGYQPFMGACRFRGQEFSLHTGASEAQLKALFGEPYWRDEDEDEVILFYEWGDIEWQVELDHPDRLKVIIVLTPPLLAAEGQRAAYHVTRPWPPDLQHRD